MKTKVLFFLLLVITISCDGDPENIECLPINLHDHIIAFYPFTSGDLTDFSKNKNTLTNTKATLATDRNGNTNCAFSFNATNNSFLKTSGLFTNNFHKNKFSISLWYKPQGTRDPGDLEYLITRTQNNNSNLLPNWSLDLGDCRAAQFGVVGKYLRDDKDTTITCSELIPDLSEKWHHLVCTYDGLTMILYRNGIKSNRTQDANPFGPSFVNDGDIFIGLEYTGVIDDVIIFDKTLSVSEILDLFESDPCCL